MDLKVLLLKCLKKDDFSVERIYINGKDDKFVIRIIKGDKEDKKTLTEDELIAEFSKNKSLKFASEFKKVKKVKMLEKYYNKLTYIALKQFN